MIEIKNLFKIYNEAKPNEFKALKDINLSINDGEIVIIKGVSGSGKSTLLSLIAGFSMPSSGEILINSQNISKLPDIMGSNIRHTQIGFIFQSFNLLDGLNVEQNVQAPLSLTKLKKDELKSMTEEAMNIANIAHKKWQNISSLSGGEKQRCAIARALVMQPNIILADEPTANLDKENSLIFIDMIKKFKELNKTLIIATHDLLFDELSFVDRIIHMQNGEIL
ncbi:ABC transporter ATP-binding protein [Campylobacter sp. faydin G-140]|uniref:ABC transporter ATP-binding protein n=1 Tax=Campylobacter anatolicus TaxID=2829105 RepID=UPI001B9D598E|nr:ABC transporter ATP-binding protein [Campylobacter anatolicus]MBR8461333.1 ABC transporter ATP-binding protein [Campylobacter anatolicus]MBR8466303.1 ABC transporter ATP-binding protein [Campylobacter anatolicus]